MTDYGTCLACVNDIDDRARTVSGMRAVAESIARRLTTPRGRLIGDPNYGFDVTQYLNADMSNRDVAELRSAIVLESLKDERLDSVAVEIDLSVDGKMSIFIELDGADGPFDFVLSVTELTVELLRAP